VLLFIVLLIADRIDRPPSCGPTIKNIFIRRKQK